MHPGNAGNSWNERISWMGGSNQSWGRAHTIWVCQPPTTCFRSSPVPENALLIPSDDISDPPMRSLRAEAGLISIFTAGSPQPGEEEGGRDVAEYPVKRKAGKRKEREGK